MNRYLVAMVVVTLSTLYTEAGPLGLFKRGGSTNNQNNNSGGNQQVTYNNRPFLGTAQGVANHLASLGRGVFHMGGNPYAYEGVGMGSSPDQALRNCCNNGGVVADYGVCQASNGMWYACKRYNGR